MISKNNKYKTGYLVTAIFQIYRTPLPFPSERFTREMKLRAAPLPLKKKVLKAIKAYFGLPPQVEGSGGFVGNLYLNRDGIEFKPWTSEATNLLEAAKGTPTGFVQSIKDLDLLYSKIKNRLLTFFEYYKLHILGEPNSLVLEFFRVIVDLKYSPLRGKLFNSVQVNTITKSLNLFDSNNPDKYNTYTLKDCNLCESFSSSAIAQTKYKFPSGKAPTNKFGFEVGYSSPNPINKCNGGNSGATTNKSSNVSKVRGIDNLGDKGNNRNYSTSAVLRKIN